MNLKGRLLKKSKHSPAWQPLDHLCTTVMRIGLELIKLEYEYMMIGLELTSKKRMSYVESLVLWVFGCAASTKTKNRLLLFYFINFVYVYFYKTHKKFKKRKGDNH